MLERFVLKNAAECTSQRLKRTSGARVMKKNESFAFGKNLDLITSIFLGLQGAISKESLHKARAHPKI